MKRTKGRNTSSARGKTSSNEYTWWQIGLFAIGSLSFIAILVVLFLPIGKGPSNFDYSGPVPPVSSPKFVNMIAESMNAPLKQAGSIEVLNNGDAFLKSFLADIDGAKSSIDVMVYLYLDRRENERSGS
ncbi:MAG TPA: hypothetical protein VGO54_16315 [Bradyrhizobium sp.]|nr:hypothetical protein [Bradyrhizobium sp.]